MMQPAVTISGVSRTFPGGVQALSPMDLEIPRGQFIAIIGPSGCGKSTLLRLVAGLDHPTTGHIQVDNSDQQTDGGGLAFVFQDAHLLPWRNVIRNVALPLELRGVATGKRMSAAKTA